MKWLEHPDRHLSGEAEDLAYSPSGSRGKIVILGIILPSVIGWFAVQSWISEEATWFGHHNTDLTLHGAAARAMAVAHASVGLFCHFRWFWGLIPVYRVFEIGVSVSALGFLGGLGFACYFAFF